MAAAHNKGVYKSPLGHCRSKVSRLCENCGKSFTAEVRRIEAGGAHYCSRPCNPSYRPREPQAAKNRRANLKANYGLTVAEYEAMVDVQGGLCAICGRPPTSKHGVLYVDHSRATGTVRALLCTQCNVGLGMFGEDAERIDSAALYVRRHASDVRNDRSTRGTQ